MSAADGTGRGSIFIQNETLRRGFTSTPNRVLCDARLSMGARFVYTLLLSYAWQDDRCFPGQERLARDVGCSVRTVQRYLAELEDADEIRVIQQGLQRPNIYVILDRRAEATAVSRQDTPTMASPRATPLSAPEAPALTDPDPPPVAEDKGRHKRHKHKETNPPGGGSGQTASANNIAPAALAEGRRGSRDRPTGVRPPPQGRRAAATGTAGAETVRLLLAEGISRPKAVTLAARYTREQIMEQLGWLDGRRYSDRAACLVAAIEGRYGPPMASRKRGELAVPAPSDDHRSDASSPYTGGAYGVCPACLSSPCDPECPMAAEHARST